MARLGVTTADVAAALRAQNAQYAAGRIGSEPAPPGQSFVYTVTATGRLVEPEEFGEIVVRAAGPAGLLRLKDIARIELGALNYDTSNTLDGQPTIGMATYLQPGANALEVAQQVRTRMRELKAGFPEGVDYTIPFDTTRFVDASIKEVTKTIVEAALLVLAVVFLFLQTWRATLIPMIAVPVSLIGAFAGLWLVGFSHQHADLVRAGARHRHRGGRRHRGAGERRAPDARERHARLRSGARGDARSVGSGRRHRARAVRGVHPGRVPRRHRRPALPAVRGDAHVRGRDLRLHRAHAHPGAVRDPDEARRAPRAHLRTIQSRLRLDDPAVPGRRGVPAHSSRRFAGRVRGRAGGVRGDVHARAEQLRPARGPGLYLRQYPAARRRDAGAHAQHDRGG